LDYKRSKVSATFLAENFQVEVKQGWWLFLVTFSPLQVHSSSLELVALQFLKS